MVIRVWSFWKKHPSFNSVTVCLFLVLSQHSQIFTYTFFGFDSDSSQCKL
jgi:hypothetical protein